MRDYELTLIYSAKLSSTDLSKLNKDIKTLIEKHKGKVVKKDDWGKKEFAYTIRKQKEGVYMHFLLQLPAIAVAKLEKEFSLMEGVVRYLFIVSG